MTNQIAGLGSSLINTEFGIHDQDFDNRLKLEENRVNQINQLSLGQASVAGSGLAGIGNVLNTAGQGLFAYGNSVFNSNLFSKYQLPLLTAQLAAAGINRNPGVAVPVLGSPNISLPSTTNYPSLGDANSGLGTNVFGGNGVLPLLPGNRTVDLVGGSPVAPIYPFGSQVAPLGGYTSFE